MSLSDIKGQERAVEILRRSVQQERIAHAYLFLGPSGTGKKKTALEFAKLLNCESSGSDSCGHCSSCIKIEKSIHPDVSVIFKDANLSFIPIDKIRDIQRRIALKAFEAKYKIAIIADAEDMSEEASNCLLKVLEEPTPDTLLILTISSQRRIPATVISRCQIIRFRPLTIDEVNNILIKDFSIEEKEAKFLSALSGASISKALILKDKDALLWKNLVIDEFNSYRSRLGSIEDSVLSNERKIHMEAMDILIGFYRDVLVYKFVKDDNMIINIDRIKDIEDLAERAEAEKISEAIKDIEEARSSISSNANLKLAISVLKENLAF
ncbi:MAG: DNA polymerase III subunit delta' [Candidatus Omnitrophota bacterium]